MEHNLQLICYFQIHCIGPQDLEAVVTKRMEKDGLKGMAIVGGATLAFGALVGFGIAMAKKN